MRPGVIEEAVADPVPSRLCAITAARKAKWIVAGLWLAVFLGSFALDLPGRFADAEQNENLDYLPASAESTKALGVTERLNDGDVAPAIVVYRRDGGLTPGDRAVIAASVVELNRATRAFENTTPFGAPVVSRDGTTALVQNQVKVTGEDEDILNPVEAYRDVVDDAPGIARPGAARLVGHGYQATVSQQAAEVVQARDRITPEHHRVDGENLVERLVEGGQVFDRAEPQVDHSALNRLDIEPPRPPPHQL